MTASPLLSISLHVLIPLAIPNGWTWGPWAHTDPAGIERLTDLAELPRLLRSYARAAAEVLRFKDADSFNVTAFGARSGTVLGRDQWAWDAEFRVYRAHGEPWVPALVTERLCVTQEIPVIRLAA